MILLVIRKVALTGINLLRLYTHVHNLHWDLIACFHRFSPVLQIKAYNENYYKRIFIGAFMIFSIFVAGIVILRTYVVKEIKVCTDWLGDFNYLLFLVV